MSHVLCHARWGLLAAFIAMAAEAPLFARVLINEIHYNPDVKTEPAEFVELLNSGAAPVDLSSWRLTGAVEFTIPNGVSIAGGAYVVIAQNPPTLLTKYGAAALGPWAGKLDNEGGRIVLLNASGLVEDVVEYQSGFPWPTVGDPPGFSIELVNPAFDNDQGGNWRTSVAGTNAATGRITLIPEQSTWKYFKGLSEASSPATAWRALGFDDSGWLSGRAPIGYDPAVQMGTTLSDMKSSYTTVFFRKIFVVEDVAAITSLVLEALYDDGFKIWINGNAVRDGAFGMPTGEVPFDATATGSARESSDFVTFDLDAGRSFLRPGTNILAVQAANINLGGSSDFFLDLRLIAQTGPANRGPTPGALNTVTVTNIGPQIRQVDHSPKEPRSGESVAISARVTDPDGVRSVSLQYQIVDPGAYVELTDPAYATNWVTLVMNDSGINGDDRIGDSVFTASLPSSVQQHRRLVRYRISATDNAGLSITVPYADDPQPNFAYFCYDGVPAWQAAVRPGNTPPITFSTDVMRRLPVIHLISKKAEVEEATWLNRYGGDAYLWTGTLVYDGEVYDHIHFRARGGVWRYAMVKNMWKFDFNRGHYFQMRDDYGRKYKNTWTKLNLGSCIQQGDYGHRGEQGMFESVGLRLFNLAGVEAPRTTYLQFRVIDEAAEASPTTQYEGDFWGVYLAVEQEDGRFLGEHDLPDGNFYKMDSGVTPYPYGDIQNQGAREVTDKSDLAAFVSGLNSSSPVGWWQTNWFIPNGCSYQAIVQGIHHYDISAGKNYFYFHNPEKKIWTVHAWDLDLTWANNMYDAGGEGGEVFKIHAIPKPAINLEYRNRVREIRDLLFNADQAWKLIDECALLLRGPDSAATILEADRCQWDYNPKMNSSSYSTTLSKAGQGRFYQWPNESNVSKDFKGCIQLMKNYIGERSTLLDSHAADPSIPSMPSISYQGPAGFPLNHLVFRSSDYSGGNPFAAMKWRVGEIWDPAAPATNPSAPRPYEITAVWESDELPAFAREITVPSSALRVGHAYRARVRMKDSTGRWSRWSQPVQFIAGLPDNAQALVDNLRVSELMVDPRGGSDFEFIELRNASASAALDLEGAKFTSGVDFAFPSGSSLAPGGHLLVIRHTNQAAFRAWYKLSAAVPIFGPYSGSLANQGEQLTLKTGSEGSEVFSFEFGKGRGWPVAAFGAGHSLVPLGSATQGQATGALDYPGNWRASARIGGSPGELDPPAQAPAVLLNEVAAHTDYKDPAHPEYDSNDWLELVNPTGTDLPLNDYYLSDAPADLRKWAIPTITLPARSRVVFDEVTGFHNPITSGFGLNKAGEQILLSWLPGTSEDRVVDEIQFKGQENGLSLSRYPDAGPWWYRTMTSSNAPNTADLGILAITEIMYHPPDLGTNDNTRDEFIEIQNFGGAPVVLQDTNGVWRLDGGVGFYFPANTTIPARSVALVVNFNPADPVALGAFWAAYGFTNTSAQVFGPYSGKLGNRSDRIAIEKPQYPDVVGDPYSWVVLDEVIYGNQDPWPVIANGQGRSLARRSNPGSGLDPANWTAAEPTPGAVQSAVVDRDGDGMPDSWEGQHGLNSDDPADAALDSDLDGKTNLEEFLSGTDPRDPASVLQFSSVVDQGNSTRLSFTAVAGKSYTVQFRPFVDSGSWQRVKDVPADPATRQVTVDDDMNPGQTARFYRLITPALP